jgi:hypothetical protein
VFFVYASVCDSHLRRTQLRGPNHLLVQFVTQETADSSLSVGVCLEDFTASAINLGLTAGSSDTYTSFFQNPIPPKLGFFLRRSQKSEYTERGYYIDRQSLP